MMVLLVEDHADTRDMYAGYLARRGVLVETAVTGLQAITKASLFAPDAVVMDLGLAGLDGWEATRRLRSSLHTSDVPVIVLSAHVDEESEARAMAAGASLFLTKPCAPGALWEALHIVCRSRARAVAALEPSGSAAGSAVAPAPARAGAPPRPLTRDAPRGDGHVAGVQAGLKAGRTHIVTGVTTMTDEEPPFRVLMIEDNPDDAQLIQRVLAAADGTRWEIEVVESLAAGLDALDHRAFDVVLMDLGLPDAVDLHGLEYVRSHAPTVPVIVLTGRDDEAAGIAALRHGAQDYIVKERAKAAVLSRALRYARERGRVERALRESEERYRLLVETASDIIYRTDEGGHFTYVNAAAVHALGYEEEHVRGRHFLELIREDHREKASQFYKRQVKEGVRQSYFEFPAVGKDGREVWIGQNVQSLVGEAGFHAIARDITERKRLEDERDQLQSRLRQFFTLSLELLCIAGFDGYFKELNTAWERTLGFTKEELKAVPFSEFVHPDDRSATAAEMARLTGVDGAESASFENRYRCKDGRYRWLLWSAAVSAEKTLVYAAARDISDRKQREEDLVHEAGHDPLTGLPNRTHVLDRLGRLLERARRTGGRVAALYVDLDFFKTVNDTLGHSAGDEFLVKMSRRLENCVRPGDLVGRLGGDEFVVVLHDVADGAAALKVADRIQHELAVPFALRGQGVRGSASIGAALSTARHGHAADLLRDSDAAMYQAKTSGRGRAVLWTDDAPEKRH